MKKFLCSALIVFSSMVFGQEKILNNIDFSSPENIKGFADFLYCQKDYLRAADEYQRYLKLVPDDTSEFKIGLAYLSMNNYSEAEKDFLSVKASSVYYKSAQLMFLKSVFMKEDYAAFKNDYLNRKNLLDAIDSAGAARLYEYSFLLNNEPLPTEDIFVNKFPEDQKSRIKYFYNWKIDPPVKSPLKAALLSAIFPGAGKFYSGEYQDGIWAFIAVAGLAYLSYDNFNAKHYARGWIFGGLAAGFYAGNIYGAAASVQIYNAKIKFDFINEVKSFLENKNYFLRAFNFCR